MILPQRGSTYQPRANPLLRVPPWVTGDKEIQRPGNQF
jgi:hypothetical protein